MASKIWSNASCWPTTGDATKRRLCTWTKDACLRTLQSFLLISSTAPPSLHFRIKKFPVLESAFRQLSYKYRWNRAKTKCVLTFCWTDLGSWSEEGDLQRAINIPVCQNKLRRIRTRIGLQTSRSRGPSRRLPLRYCIKPCCNRMSELTDQSSCIARGSPQNNDSFYSADRIPRLCKTQWFIMLCRNGWCWTLS